MKKILLIFSIITMTILSGCTDSENTTNISQIGNAIDLTDTSEEYTAFDIEEFMTSAYELLTEKDINVDQYYEDYVSDDYTVLLPTDLLTITEKGVYVLEGTYTETIVIDVEDEDVTLILNNATISVMSGPAILVLNAEDVTISAPAGTENNISDSENHPETVDLEDYNATIYSKSDLVINGSGTINIDAYYNNAINSKDDVKILEVTLNITSVDDGIIGNDSLSIRDAIITLDVMGDGLISSNDEKVTKGFILIISGTFDLTVGADGIQAVNDVFIYDGTVTIDSADNGIQSDSNIYFGGGIFDITSGKDAINATNNLVIYNGDFTIHALDDAIHADVDLTIDGGTIFIESSYEGIEGLNIYINGGTVSVNATDDGINATTGGGQEHGPQYVSLGGTLTITGGIIQVSAMADGVDVNGSATMSGGYLIVFGPTVNTQAPIDYDESFDITGGVIVSLGSIGMMLPLSDTSSQMSLLYAGTILYKAGTSVSLLDSDGNTIIAINSLKSFAGAVVSTPDMEMDETYTLHLDNDSYEFTIETTVTYLGTIIPTEEGGGVLPPRR